VQGAAVNAHGTLSPAGLLAFARAPVAGQKASLVVRSTDGREEAKSFDEGSVASPLFSPDGRHIFCFLFTDHAMDLVGMRLDNPREPSVGRTVFRQLLVKSSERALAYQCSASVAPCLPGYSDDAPATPLVILHPVMGRMAVLDLGRGVFSGLAPRSQAAVASPFPGNPGYFQTTPEGLTFSPPPRPGDASAKPALGARLMDQPYVPRITTNPDRPFVLLGPAGKDPNRLVILGMGLAPPAQD
jgi:hypothetical protein